MVDLLGSRVSIPGTRCYGILRYYGPIDGKIGIFGGIELVGPIAASRGKNSGAVDGKQYFEVEHPMTGLFLPLERLKSVNPHLSRLNSSVQGNDQTEISDITDTPSPTSRGTRVPASFSTRGQQKITILKRKSLNNQSRVSSPIKETDIPKAVDLKEEDDFQAKYKALKEKYELMSRESFEKNAILDDLRSTVNEIQPLLEEYEHDAIEKDKRLERQKIEFENARRDWKDTLDLMVSNQQENELLFETQITDLNRKIEQYQALSNDQPTKEDVKELRDDLNATVEEKEKMRLEFEAKILRQTEEIKELEGRLSLLSSSNLRSNDHTYEIEHLKLENKKLKGKLLELESHSRTKNEEMEKLLLKSVGSITLTESHVSSSENGGLNDSESSHLKKIIEDLKIELESRPTFEERNKLNKSIEELKSLHNLEISTKDKVLDEFLSLDLSEKQNHEKLSSQKSILMPEVEPQPKVLTEHSINTLLSSQHLPIYKPEKKLDPSEGKASWCGLCEREGHTSLHCPYENDLF
ncbi:uncharacterized protein PRCAT00000031001 [Priceomyces carsonii]|uniref:uncharacterized protein n=1 Tax=Priceomyces carsonii TaxID=28549 RepID=UPI002EDB2324|nr:unnamed protein product [Priceomyces carsonii]